MNRAVRRKQGKEPSSRKERRAAAKPAIVTPKPGKSKGKRDASSSGGILSWRPRYVMDVINELRKVVWPTRDDVIYLTIVVVIIVIIFGAVLGLIDIAFGWFVDNTILQ